ncbi:hypothetical protein MKW94_019799 [Papaver nudicaule]|uniref:Protein kinase domain-containing protein n=1 Tax=Papaver nudicaule TaxID=74823 RepID=A0AA41SAV7_PAPNU|nr:hypothetical protein [Papaver nudicaule]
MEMQFKREKLLGCGGQAEVFLASTLTQYFSSNVLPPLIAVKSVDTMDCVPLMRENQILEDLGGCQSIIKHYGVRLTLENGQMIYNILLEFAEGGSLFDQIQTYGANGLPETEVRDFTESILLGLKHIHDHGYVHRDIKPENILICKNNEEATGIKRYPLYMAPETVIYGEYRPSSDVWALVLEMLTGNQAWNLPPKTELKTLFSYIASEYPLAPTWISSEARDFMIRCFSKDLRYRWTVDMLLRHLWKANGDSH